MKNKAFLLKLALAVLLSLSLLVVVGTGNTAVAFDYDEYEHHSGRIFTMVDQDGEVIMRTARQIVVGDEYINMANNYYRVVSVDGETAVAEEVERQTAAAEPVSEGFIARVSRLLRNSIPVQQQEGQDLNRRIGIYNSHGAESYIEGDGEESKDPGGGIIDVGDRLAEALEGMGVEVLRSQEPHTPHDAGAYNRSKRTVEEFLKEDPDALIDVHRDAVPEEEYLEEVEGEERVQVQFVVGRQNQNMEVNKEFAEGLKARADELYPGLVKGIFMARGSYNQEMSPQATLIEVGSHTNNKDQALETMDLFAEVVNDFLYEGEGDEIASPAPGTPDGPGGTALRSALWVIAGLVVAVGIFLVVSAGGFEQAKEKLSKFRNKEFSNTMGLPPDEEEPCDKCKEDKPDGGNEGS
ncbi:stage II sporulation protein P [Dethiobacter alkaliphilus]|uniref:Stage II sporulation protein P n=1 Tax=Dethiobacter alkaliphilus AHT 1 TaxID=555088 RepID=C0GI45_DETAL|nr:stage II sporulation protein P [Dethiobacter alkaliphilus]EEG77119.1 stage II sporulation protein P [Dethiobacter alkaliphilus AHT 1]